MVLRTADLRSPTLRLLEVAAAVAGAVEVAAAPGAAEVRGAAGGTSPQQPLQQRHVQMASQGAEAEVGVEAEAEGAEVAAGVQVEAEAEVFRSQSISTDSLIDFVYC